MRSVVDVKKGVRVLGVMIVLGLVAGGVGSARADDKLDAEQMVTRAKLVVDGFAADKKMESLHENVKKARAMLIVPEALRAAFIIGGQGGSGVLVARDVKSGRWMGPTFHSMGGASFGFQAGADSAQVIALAMTERGGGRGQRRGRRRHGRVERRHPRLLPFEGPLRRVLGRGQCGERARLAQQGVLRQGGQSV
jgi:hypothetical protein